MIDEVLGVLTKTVDVICRMRENVDCPNFFYIPANCMSDMDYVIAAINYIITSFGGKYCIHLFL